MGLQDGKDVEMPLSNTEDGSEGGQTAHNDQQAKDGEQGDSKGEDTDGDLILDDARNGGQTASDTEPSKGAEQGTDKKD